MYSKNFIERMRQIHHKLPRGAFPTGTLPCYALYLSDEETDRWVEEQWARNPRHARPREQYNPSIHEVTDELVTSITRDMEATRAFSMQAKNGAPVYFIKRGRLWTSRYSRSVGVSVSYNLTSAVRDALELGYRYVFDRDLEYAGHAS